jgi:hypothetical protein
MRDVYGKEIDELLKLGLIERFSLTRAERSDIGDEARRWRLEESAEGESLRLTKHGRLLGNQVFMRFV